jgi:predicted O-methyltransferase YrrM
MQKHLFRLTSLFGYHLRKQGLRKLHSPFVYELASEVLAKNKLHDSYKTIRLARRMMLMNYSIIETVDFGALSGGSKFKTYRIRVRKLAKKRIGTLRDMELLNRLTRHFGAEYILEFGTSTGLSSVAIASSHPAAKLISMEGCASVASVAQSVFDRLGLENIKVEIGNFNILLKEVLQKMPRLDMVFFDGNHRKTDTINYFRHCLAKAHPGSIFVFDDIRWSPEMYEAWQSIAASKEVSISIELRKMGIVFFRHGIEKQHFVLA